MADRDITGLQYQRSGVFAPYGNLNQVVIENDLDSVARVATDLDFLTELPKGATVTKVQIAIVSSTASASNIDVGTKQKGSGGWTDDPDTFFDGQAVNAEGTFNSLGNTRHAPLFISEERVFLTVTYNAAVAAGDDLHIRYYIEYVVGGNK